jgi:hypothetical protein
MKETLMSKLTKLIANAKKLTEEKQYVGAVLAEVNKGGIISIVVGDASLTAEEKDMDMRSGIQTMLVQEYSKISKQLDALNTKIAAVEALI